MGDSGRCCFAAGVASNWSKRHIPREDPLQGGALPLPVLRISADRPTLCPSIRDRAAETCSDARGKHRPHREYKAKSTAGIASVTSSKGMSFAVFSGSRKV